MDFYSIAKDDMDDVEKQMEEYLSGKDKRVYGQLLPFIKLGGKRMRPLLTLISFRAFGGKDIGKLKKIASIIELFHNFTLIHDDIEDDSKFRRGEPTMHVAFGIPIALNSGDALYTLIWEKLAGVEMDPAQHKAVMQSCASSFSEVVEGQGIELYWEKNNLFDISEKDYYTMIGKKTAALIGLSCRVGAYLAGASSAEQSAIEEFGKKIGTAFQIHDDFLNLVGDFKKYQKEIGGDITEGKRTLMVVKTLEKSSADDAKNLKAILSSHTENPAKIKQAIEIMKKYRSLDYAEENAKTLILDAKKDLAAVKQSKYKDALLAIADFVVSREK
jgi:geranylgeranyl diphosphate synthase type I